MNRKEVTTDSSTASHSDAKNGFIKALATVIRAQQPTNQLLDQLTDGELLTDYLLVRLPGVTDSCHASAEAVSRVQWFYAAIALEVEHRSGAPSAAMVMMSQENFGRALVTSGRLVVVNSYLRHVNRFGFVSCEALNQEAERLIEEALQWIRRFPEPAAEH